MHTITITTTTYITRRIRSIGCSSSAYKAWGAKNLMISSSFTTSICLMSKSRSFTIWPLRRWNTAPLRCVPQKSSTTTSSSGSISPMWRIPRIRPISWRRDFLDPCLSTRLLFRTFWTRRIIKSGLNLSRFSIRFSKPFSRTLDLILSDIVKI